MSLADQYPRKKRRLFLNAKTSPFAKGHTQDITACVKEISQSLKSQLIRSPIVANSSDESSLEIGEIGWDNNSFSPASLCKGKSRRTKKGKSTDIQNILKGVSKKKKQLTDEKNEHDDNADTFSAWMQINLAKNCDKENKLRRSSKRKARKKGALNFNEELKKFMEQVIPSGDVGCSDHNMSVEDVTKEDDCLNDADNLSDIILDDLDCTLIDNKKSTPFPLTKTPKLRRSFHVKTTPDHENIFMKKFKFAEKDAPKTSIIVKENTSNHKFQPTNHNKIKNKVPSLKPDRDVIEDLEFDDELDQILTQQVFETETKFVKPKEGKTEDYSNSKGSKNTVFTKILHCGKDSEVNSETRPTKKVSTPISKVNEQFELDDDMFSDEIFNDMDTETEFRCKSQDTPPVVSVAVSQEQRKLKRRSHTSPFPVSKRRIIQSSSTVVAKPLCTDVDDHTHKESLKFDNNTSKHKLILDEYKATNACRKPFKPPFKKSLDNEADILKTQQPSRIHLNQEKLLEFSTIGLPVRNVEEDLDFPKGEKEESSFIPFSSTQRCSFEEIERKRREAQLRLKEKLKRK